MIHDLPPGSIGDLKRASSNRIRRYTNLSTPVGLKTQIFRFTKT